MRPIQTFSLERHDGPYERWPARTRLLRDGVDTGVDVPGYTLLHQLEVPGSRFLLITDHDCPWEEDTRVLLLDERLRVIASSTFGPPWGYFLLKDVTVVDERTLDLSFDARAPWRVTVLDRRRRWFGSLLHTRRLGPESP